MPEQIIITEPDLRLLAALNRFHYLTAAQASRLLYPRLKDNNRYMQRRLKRLSDGGYVLRLAETDMPRFGASALVFTLARRGRQFLQELDYSVTDYFRPSEEREKIRNRLFMTHTLAAIDVLLSADMLCSIAPVTCEELRCERELRHTPVQVDVPPPPGSESGTRRVTVVPDGWFQLWVEGEESPCSISLERDLGSEDQKAWRRKVAALAAWAEGPYKQAFEADNITIAVVTPSSKRRDKLRAWTARELTARQKPNLLDIFLFTSSDPVATPPVRFFFDPLWYLPSDLPPLSLLDPPVEDASVSTPPEPGQTVSQKRWDVV